MDTSPDPSMPLAAQLAFLFFLICVNAFFAAAEMSMVSANKNRIKQVMADGGKQGKQAETLLKLLENPNQFLSTIQVAITFAGFLASASAAVGMSADLGRVITRLGLPYGQSIAVVLVTLILSYVTLVLGELYPKRLALNHSEKIALTFAGTIKVLSKIMSPFVYILSGTVNICLRLTGQRVDKEDDIFSEAEVMSMLEVGKETGVLKEEGKRMINSIFAFDDKFAYEIMTPRTDVFTIDIDDSPEEYVDDLMALRYSRIPVYENDSDNIIGVLYIKDYLIKARESGFDNVDIRPILREPYFVPETKNIDSLFIDLQSSKKHIAILIDEYGGFSGIVTMEDIIEEVMGDIDDEYDEDEIEIEKIDEKTYRISGFITLDDLNDELELGLESENNETLGGFLIDILGEIPPDEDKEEIIVSYENYIFQIESIKDRRIEVVKLYILPGVEERENEEGLDQT